MSNAWQEAIRRLSKVLQLHRQGRPDPNEAHRFFLSTEELHQLPDDAGELRAKLDRLLLEAGEALSAAASLAASSPAAASPAAAVVPADDAYARQISSGAILAVGCLALIRHAESQHASVKAVALGTAALVLRAGPALLAERSGGLGMLSVLSDLLLVLTSSEQHAATLRAVAAGPAAPACLLPFLSASAAGLIRRCSGSDQDASFFDTARMLAEVVSQALALEAFVPHRKALAADAPLGGRLLGACLCVMGAAVRQLGSPADAALGGSGSGGSRAGSSSSGGSRAGSSGSSGSGGAAAEVSGDQGSCCKAAGEALAAALLAASMMEVPLRQRGSEGGLPQLFDTVAAALRHLLSDPPAGQWDHRACAAAVTVASCMAQGLLFGPDLRRHVAREEGRPAGADNPALPAAVPAAIALLPPVLAAVRRLGAAEGQSDPSQQAAFAEACGHAAALAQLPTAQVQLGPEPLAAEDIAAWCAAAIQGLRLLPLLQQRALGGVRSPAALPRGAAGSSAIHRLVHILVDFVMRASVAGLHLLSCTVKSSRSSCQEASRQLFGPAWQLHCMLCRMLWWLHSLPGDQAHQLELPVGGWPRLAESAHAVVLLAATTGDSAWRNAFSTRDNARADACLARLQSLAAAHAALLPLLASKLGAPLASLAASSLAEDCRVIARYAPRLAIPPEALYGFEACVRDDWQKVASNASEVWPKVGVELSLATHPSAVRLAMELLSRGLAAYGLDLAAAAGLPASLHEAEAVLAALVYVCESLQSHATDVACRIDSTSPEHAAALRAAAAELQPLDQQLEAQTLLEQLSSARQALVPPATRLAAALQAAYASDAELQQALQLELAQAGALRSCAHLRCANLAGEGGVGAGEGAGSSKCSACRSVWYCNTTCSHADWRGPTGHRKACKALAAARPQERQQRAAAAAAAAAANGPAQ